jgi:RND family efflux transporter MFP subunit
MSPDSTCARDFTLAGLLLLAVVSLSCGGKAGSAEAAGAAAPLPEVAVVPAARANLKRTLVVSSELVPFQQIDVYAKEAGFVQILNVDYGTHVKTGDVMAVLEIPELRLQLDEDQADIDAAAQQIAGANDELARLQAEQTSVHLQFTRLDAVAKKRPGLVAQQEIDDWQSKDLAAAARTSAGRASLDTARSQLARAQARQRRDQALFEYSRITAPFSGVVTKRYANQGTLMQSATTSSTSVLPLVQLSQDDRFRLVIPVPESYVRFIRKGDPVEVRVPSLNRSFPGTVSRFSVDVEADTRTMHTEVDVPNPNRVLMPGVYAEATLTLERQKGALSVPQQAVLREPGRSSVWRVEPDGRVEKTEVSLGMENPEEVEVLSGLKDGDLVAVGDRGALQNGEFVRPRQIRLLQYHGSP